jgi:hypothetical protein
MTQKNYIFYMTKKIIITTSLGLGVILLTGVSVFAYQNGFINSYKAASNSQTSQQSSQEISSFSSSQQSSLDEEQYHQQQTSQIQNLPVESLSQGEKDTLFYMREEEKLARDVYLTMADKYSVQVFSNIAQSEQKHMDTLKTILDKYNLPDSVTTNEIGKFNDPQLAQLYLDLVAKGSQNQVEALKVGATIEDLDISDLNKAVLENDNQDIKMAYQNLLNGSYNHLRSFVKNINSAGGQYSPQFISQTEYQTILSGTNGNGNSGGGNGNGGNGKNH